MSYKCAECGFTGEGWHKWNCSRGSANYNINPNFTPVLKHFNKLSLALEPAPTMLPVVKDE